MSYAEQIGDKFYEMNPKDAREGDQHKRPADGRWLLCGAYENDGKCAWPKAERRRLIAPGEGWRILGVGHSLPERFEFTTDGMTWLLAIVPDCELQTISTWITKDVIAIRQRIPVEAGKKAINCESCGVLIGQLANKFTVCQTCFERANKFEEQMPLDPRIQRVIDAAREDVRNCSRQMRNALKSALAALDTKPTKDDEWPRYWLSELLDWQSLTPAEAQARMEGDDFEELAKKHCLSEREILLIRLARDAAKVKGGGV